MTDPSYIMLIRITISVEHETAFIHTFHRSAWPGLTVFDHQQSYSWLMPFIHAR